MLINTSLSPSECLSQIWGESVTVLLKYKLASTSNTVQSQTHRNQWRCSWATDGGGTCLEMDQHVTGLGRFDDVRNHQNEPLNTKLTVYSALMIHPFTWSWSCKVCPEVTRSLHYKELISVIPGRTITTWHRVQFYCFVPTSKRWYANTLKTE